jgi:hypothetical protein
VSNGKNVSGAAVNFNKNVNSNIFKFRPKSRKTTRNRKCSKMLISRFLVVSRDFDCFVGVYVFAGVYSSSGYHVLLWLAQGSGKHALRLEQVNQSCIALLVSGI